MIVISLGIKGVLFLLYLIIEFLFIKNQRRSLLLSFIPYLIMIRAINKELPFGWKVHKILYHFFYVYNPHSTRYCVMVEVKSKVIKSITYDFIYFNSFGKIIAVGKNNRLGNLIYHSERENARFSDLVRNQKLKELGI